jgi:transcriptional regulator with XRE-family HTH domain
MEFAEALRALMAERGISGNALAQRAYCDRALISRYAAGKQQPSAKMARRLDEVLGAGGKLAASAVIPAAPATMPEGSNDEVTALELGRRMTASGAGESIVTELERAADEMAVAYPRTPPRQLLGRVRAHLGYVTSLLDGQMTLAEHRRLLVSGAWLSLLAATCLIDLQRRDAASAHLRTAAQIASETGHAEITAWCLETRAWQTLTDGDYRRAAGLAQAAQRAAPRDSSAFIQATGQESRAWARLGAKREAYDALARTEALAGQLPPLDQPEHHFRYDPAKSQAYTATMLSWIGDPAAAAYARQVIARMESTSDGTPRPRRATSARLDLALALTATAVLDEAAAAALDVVTSGRLVPSNYWRAEEVIAVIIGARLPEAPALQEAYRECRRDSPPALPPG